MKKYLLVFVSLGIPMFIMSICFMRCTPSAVAEGSASEVKGEDGITAYAKKMLEEGQHTFRFETFGDEAYWTDALQLNKAIAGEKNGGVGPGLSPKAALAAGLKVDMDVIPADVAAAIKAGKVNLDDPAVTLTLLQLNAVVGVKGTFDNNKKLVSIGITCASCHSTVDDAFLPGIGHRLDGWANRDLNVGAVIGMAPNLKPLTDALG
ncbi:MAG: hypothetical protein WBB36_09765, partial [Chitinophagales bacterium]